MLECQNVYLMKGNPLEWQSHAAPLPKIGQYSAHMHPHGLSQQTASLKIFEILGFQNFEIIDRSVKFKVQELLSFKIWIWISELQILKSRIFDFFSKSITKVIIK